MCLYNTQHLCSFFCSGVFFPALASTEVVNISRPCLFTHIMSLSLDFQRYLWYKNHMEAPAWEKNAEFSGGDRGGPSNINIL